MRLADIMKITPKEFYGIYGKKAELYSEQIRKNPSLPGSPHAVKQCSETGMCDELFRYRCVYLSKLYDNQ